MNRPIFMTVEDVATMLHRAPKTIYDWVGLNKIPHIKLPTGGVLFDLEQINSWIAQHAVPGEVKRPKKAA